MFDEKKHKYLFRCEDCGMVVSVDLENEQDLKDVQENKMDLQCPCGSKCSVLRD